MTEQLFLKRRSPSVVCVSPNPEDMTIAALDAHLGGCRHGIHGRLTRDSDQGNVGNDRGLPQRRNRRHPLHYSGRRGLTGTTTSPPYPNSRM